MSLEAGAEMLTLSLRGEIVLQNILKGEGGEFHRLLPQNVHLASIVHKKDGTSSAVMVTEELRCDFVGHAAKVYQLSIQHELGEGDSFVFAVKYYKRENNFTRNPSDERTHTLKVKIIKIEEDKVVVEVNMLK